MTVWRSVALLQQHDEDGDGDDDVDKVLRESAGRLIHGTWTNHLNEFQKLTFSLCVLQGPD